MQHSHPNYKYQPLDTQMPPSYSVDPHNPHPQYERAEPVPSVIVVNNVYEDDRPNHLLHCIITILCPWWILVWLCVCCCYGC